MHGWKIHQAHVIEWRLPLLVKKFGRAESGFSGSCVRIGECDLSRVSLMFCKCSRAFFRSLAHPTEGMARHISGAHSRWGPVCPSAAALVQPSWEDVESCFSHVRVTSHIPTHFTTTHVPINLIINQINVTFVVLFMTNVPQVEFVLSYVMTYFASNSTHGINMDFSYPL